MWKIVSWLRRAWPHVRDALTPSVAAWSGAANALIAFWAFLLLAVIVGQVIPDFSVEKLIGLAGIFVVLGLITAGALLVVWAGARLSPRFRFAFLLCLPPAVLFAAPAWQELGLAVAPLILLGVSVLFGAGAALLARPQTGRIISLVYLAIGIVLLAVAAFGYLRMPADPNPALAGYHLKGRTLALPDPGKPGPYKVDTFTYGSGTDRQRPEFASGVRIVSKPVDASKLDEEWTGFGGWVRSLYWGFDRSKLPVQGRVWMPRGAGPFPLVLIVHGNHQMEDFSDPGYDYLGTLLASQGFILASVDENFLNSSLADFADVFHMRSGSETRVRGWLLLEHLAQWRGWNKDKRNLLFGKVDMNRIGLIGHSRGGEAVAVANAFNDLGHYPDDATLPFNYHFKLGAIIAIAPVDGQYKPRHRPTPMSDTNYLVIHGSMDGDVYSFMGSSQYARATFSPGSKAFKATVYLKDANHGQFNTSWGRNDMGMPFGVFLDERPIMDPDAQRRVAQVYFSAFLQLTLNGKDGYRPLFEDARNGAGWLPDAFILNNYADADTRWLATYDDDIDPSSGSAPGVTLQARNLSVWREDFVELKMAHLDSHVAVLAWDDRFKKGARYEIDLGAASPVPDAGASLVFALSSAGIETLPDGFDPPEGSTPDKPDQPLDWTVVLVDTAGAEARLPLSRDQVVYPQVKANTRRIPEVSAVPTAEIVMRRFHLRLSDFVAANPRLDLTHLRAIRFDFDKSPRGAVAVDDVGFGR